MTRERRSGRTTRVWGAGAAALLGLAFAVGPAHSEKVGVAAAVNPDAFSSLSGAPQSQLNIGKSIFYNERINTTGSGLVQVLLVDGSTFTVGPGSDLVIDKFVYDPKKGTGQISASFSKGVMRFVGGKLSKNDGGVTVKTPAGALAIRGGIAFVDFKSPQTYSILFVFGEYLKLQGKTVYEPGYGFFSTNGQLQTRPFTAADVKLIIAALTNSNTTGVTTGTETSKPSPQLVNTQNLNQLIADATATQIQGAIDKQLSTEIPQPIPVTVRVLASPGVYSAYGFTTDDGSGILGGGNYGPNGTPPLAGDDFVWTFGILDGRLTGTVAGLIDANCTTPECTVIQTNPVTPNPSVDLPWFEPAACLNGRCAVTDATITQGQTTTYQGYAIRKEGFFAYHLVGNPGSDGQDRLLLFGGDAYTFAATPQGTLYKFNLTEDLLESSAFGPFASNASSPMPQNASGFVTVAEGPGQGTGYVSPLLLLDNSTSEGTGPSGGVWLQTNFFQGTGENKGQSFINIALGKWDATSGLTGERRGGSDVGSNYSFSGDIASLAGPNGSHFMGTTDPSFVIGADSTGSHNIFRDATLESDGNIGDQIGATYHVATLAESGAASTTSGGTFKGFAAGLGQQPGGDQPSIIGNLSSNDFRITLDAETNTMTASMQVGDGILQNPKYNLEFGGAGRSAYIDDTTFAAIDAVNSDGNSTSSVTVRSGFLNLRKDTYGAEMQGYLVSADAIKANEVLFAGQQVPVDPEGDPEGLQEQKRAFCQSCEFLKWGAWGARTEYDKNEQPIVNDVHLGWWIAGDVVSKDDMPTRGSATYAGDAIGTVATLGETYTATGDMRMDWNFGLRSGLLKISNFDNQSFSGLMVAPGRAEFAGPLGGPGGLIGEANGAFVGSPGAGLKPGGVIGNFGVGNSTWQASGIFGGTLRP